MASGSSEPVVVDVIWLLMVVSGDEDSVSAIKATDVEERVPDVGRLASNTDWL